MPESVNTSSSGSKLNEFYEMQRILIVFVLQSAVSDCPGYEAPVALDLGTPYFRRACRSSIVDQVHSSKKLDHQEWFKILCKASPGCKSVTQNPVTDAHIPAL